MEKHLRIMSDLHLDCVDLFLKKLDTDQDSILVLAGDINEKDRALPFLKRCSKQFSRVVYIMGNHEHWKSSLDLTPLKIRKAIQDSFLDNVVLLDNEALIVGSWVILGGTMWASLNNGCDITKINVENKLTGMRDYSKIRINNYASRFTPDSCINEFIKFKQFLLDKLKEHSDKNVVVVSHHAPHQLSLGAEYTQRAGDYYLNGNYASDMSDLILDHPNIQLWIHGHIHSSSDYKIGDCRVICNPRGNAPKYQNKTFNQNFLVDL